MGKKNNKGKRSLAPGWLKKLYGEEAKDVAPGQIKDPGGPATGVGQEGREELVDEILDRPDVPTPRPPTVTPEEVWKPLAKKTNWFGRIVVGLFLAMLIIGALFAFGIVG